MSEVFFPAVCVSVGLDVSVKFAACGCCCGDNSLLHPPTSIRLSSALNDAGGDGSTCGGDGHVGEHGAGGGGCQEDQRLRGIPGKQAGTLDVDA